MAFAEWHASLDGEGIASKGDQSGEAVRKTGTE
ncbi:hypothetical protein FHW11_002237 [Pantoea agglomerans]|nr:hypothetical protein [Pantoea agglomerans]MBA8892514.1 hypothetical protein [Pantoea agglomerans]